VGSNPTLSASLFSIGYDLLWHLQDKPFRSQCNRVW
jgi:hypothetical protein